MYVERMAGAPPFCERCEERYGAKPAPSSITPEDGAKIAAGLAILISMIVGMCSYLYRNRSAIAEKSKSFMEGAKTAVLTSVDAARQLLRRSSVPRTQIDIPSQHEAVTTPQTEQSHPLQELEAVVSQEWFVRRGDIERGPLTPSKVKQLVAKGILAATDFVRTAEEPQWREAGTVKDLFEEDPSDSELASLTIIRKPKLTGFMHSVSVSVGGHIHGSLGGGFLNGLRDLLMFRQTSMTIPISSGSHSVEVSAGWLKGSFVLEAKAGHNYALQTYFSDLGVLGGGLRLEPQP